MLGLHVTLMSNIFSFKNLLPTTYFSPHSYQVLQTTPIHTLLVLLSRFSRVRLCATPQTAAHQAPPSLGFSRQEHWSGLPFPSPMHESEVAQSCPTLCNPIDSSPPGSSIHGIFQARVLEWGAIAFSDTHSTNSLTCIRANSPPTLSKLQLEQNSYSKCTLTT